MQEGVATHIRGKQMTKLMMRLLLLVGFSSTLVLFVQTALAQS